MVRQHVLPFELEAADDPVTSQGGRVSFGEFLHVLDHKREIDRAFGNPGSGAGYPASAYVLPLLFGLHGGGRSLEDLRTIARDKGVLALPEIETLPPADAFGRGLRRRRKAGGQREPPGRGVQPVFRKRHPDRGGKTDSSPSGLPTEPPSFETRAKVLATNHREIPEWVVDWYNPRGDVSGNRIKELAIGDTQANAAFFRIGALADGLFLLFRGRILSETFARARMQTVRWQVCQIAGRAVRHAGALPLKVAEDVLPFFQALRERSYRLMGPQGVA